MKKFLYIVTMYIFLSLSRAKTKKYDLKNLLLSPLICNAVQFFSFLHKKYSVTDKWGKTLLSKLIFLVWNQSNKSYIFENIILQTSG